VRRTQKAIKQALTERYYAWRDAEAVAKSDPEVNLTGKGPIYTPSDFIEEDLVEHEDAEAAGVPEQSISMEQEVKPEQRSSPNA